jgi:hypothetical protein
MASGDDIQAGRITAGEKTTDLIAQIPTGDSPPPSLSLGGAGVTGFGGPNQGPGVIGKGGGGDKGDQEELVLAARGRWHGTPFPSRGPWCWNVRPRRLTR